MVHLVEVDLASGVIVGEWRQDGRAERPVAPEGRAFLDVSDRGEALGTLSVQGYRVVDGALVEPPPRAPVVSRVQLALLLGATARSAIRQYRRAHPDDEALEDFYELLQLAGDTIDLGSPIVSAGLGLLVQRQILTAQDEARVRQGLPVER